MKLWALAIWRVEGREHWTLELREYNDENSLPDDVENGQIHNYRTSNEERGNYLICFCSDKHTIDVFLAGIQYAWRMRKGWDEWFEDSQPKKWHELLD